jgi:hypothetical protein
MLSVGAKNSINYETKGTNKCPYTFKKWIFMNGNI